MRQEAERSRHELAEAMAAYLPQMDIAGFYSRARADVAFSAPLNAAILPPGLSNENYFLGRAMVWQRLFPAGPVARLRGDISRKKKRLEREAEAQENRVRAEAAAAFLRALEAQENRALAERALREAEGRFPSLLPDLRQRHRLSLRQERDALYRLRQACNLERDSELKLLGEAPQAPPPELTPLEDPLLLQKLQTQAVGRRPEMKASGAEEDAPAGLSLFQRALDVRVGAAYQLEGREFPLLSRSWTFQAWVSVPVFDGGGGFARGRQAAAAERWRELSESAASDRIRDEVAIAWYRLRDMWEDLARSAEQRTAAEARRHRDAAAFREWVEIEAAWIRRKAEFGVALADLERSVGVEFLK